MIHIWEMTPAEHEIQVHARLMAQNPGLNPSVIMDTICTQCPEPRRILCATTEMKYLTGTEKYSDERFRTCKNAMRMGETIA